MSRSVSLLFLTLSYLSLTGCMTLPEPPFGYESYWHWVCGCASDLPRPEAADVNTPTEESSKYLDQVYSSVREDFNESDKILEETDRFFRAHGFQLKKDTDDRGRIVQLRATIDGDIAFKTGSAELTPAALDIVDRFGDALAANPLTVSKVHGHTDTPGSKRLNRQLSLRRAQAVRTALIQRKGIAAKRIIEVKGFADDHRIIQTDAAEPRNRRTEILLLYSDR